MKKDVLKGFTMLTLILVIALATAVVSANAQSSQLMANVPFEFIVGDQTLPAGEYRVSQALSKALTIKSADAKNLVTRLASDIYPDRNKKPARLVFHRYGDRYFLSEVWRGPDSIGRQVSKSRQERTIERELATIASKSGHAESAYAIVEVAAVLR